MGNAWEARVIHHLRHAEAELGLAHALTETRQVWRVTEPILADLADLLYTLEQGVEEDEA